MLKISVVIADDDERVRADFRVLLELEPDLEVVGIAADGASVVDLARRLCPDVVVMDIRMPGMNGIDATRLLRTSNSSQTRVLVVTTFDLDEYVLGAARAGASGFLLKDQAVAELAKAVRIVAAGDALVSPRATARLLQEFARPIAQPNAQLNTGPSQKVKVLTDRELDVVRLMAKGLSNDEIAREAFVSVGTVKTHVSNVLAKLHLNSRIQIVVWAFENGLAE